MCSEYDVMCIYGCVKYDCMCKALCDVYLYPSKQQNDLKYRIIAFIIVST